MSALFDVLNESGTDLSKLTSFQTLGGIDSSALPATVRLGRLSSRTDNTPWSQLTSLTMYLIDTSQTDPTNLLRKQRHLSDFLQGCPNPTHPSITFPKLQHPPQPPLPKQKDLLRQQRLQTPNLAPLP